MALRSLLRASHGHTAASTMGGNEACTDRIVGDCEYDRHGARGLQQRCDGRSAASQDGVGREGGQFQRVSPNFGGVVRGPTGVDTHIAADGPAQ